VKEQLTRKQQLLILNMLSSASMEEACRVSGVSRSTAYRWMKTDSTFRREFADAKTQAFSQAITILSRASTTFAQVLESIATDKTAPMTARVSSCRAGLEWATRGIETEAIATDARELAEELRARKVKRNER
jgi:ACT domain-containing protein